MSAESQPISPARFAAALPSLPTSTLHAKAAELLNSLSHLQASNAQLLPFADPADSAKYDLICADSIRENMGVMKRMQERLEILRAEIEARGGRWVWGSLEDEVVGVDGLANGEGSEAVRVNGVLAGNARPQDNERSGRFTDEELARRVAERMQQDDTDTEGNNNAAAGGGTAGLHL